MIYNEKNHNFKKYFDNWDLSKNNFVLFGASKECIQLIRTIKIILPDYDFKIKYLVDLDENALGNNISLYDINKAAYKSEINTDILNDKIFEVKSFQDYLNDKEQPKIIITSDDNIRLHAGNLNYILNSAVLEIADESLKILHSDIEIENLVKAKLNVNYLF